jgi:ketosteroid isomerase-like protein
MQLVADHLVHGWDLAAATDQDRTMDPAVVGAVADWFDEREHQYRDGGAIASRRALTGDAEHDLLARFGRDAAWGPNHRTLVRFNNAFGSGDLDAALAVVTDDVVFESTSPAPDGAVHQGRDAVRRVWSEVMGTPGMAFEPEESFVSGDRAVVRWSYSWGGEQPGHVRGVDVLRFREGLVSEKLSYVKG